MNERFCILIRFSLKFVGEGSIHYKSVLVRIMAWRRIGDKSLSEPKLTRFADAYIRHLEGNELMWIIYAYPSSVIDWHWGNGMDNLQCQLIDTGAIAWITPSVSEVTLEGVSGILDQYQTTPKRTHDDVIKWKLLFRVAGPLCGEFSGHRWIPLAKGQPVMRTLMFLWCGSA